MNPLPSCQDERCRINSGGCKQLALGPVLSHRQAKQKQEAAQAGYSPQPHRQPLACTTATPAARWVGRCCVKP